MTDDGVDPRLARELRDYSQGGIRPIDSLAIAEAAVGRGWRRRSRYDVAHFVRSWLSNGVPSTADSYPEDTVVPLESQPSWPARKRSDRGKAAGLATVAAAVAVVVVAAVAGMSLLPWLGAVGGPSATTAPLPSPSPTERASDPPTPAGVNLDPADFAHSLTVEGLPFSFRVPFPRLAHGWERFGSLLVSKSVGGPQGAEAVVFWAGFPDGTYADPCINAPIESWTAADVAAGVAAAPGTVLVAGPTDVTVGGYPAKHVVVVVREDAGCDPGFFYTWKAQTGGEMWVKTELGDTIRVWVVDVDGTLIFIAGEVHRDVRPGKALSEAGRTRLEQEIQQIVDSIEFE